MAEDKNMIKRSRRRRITDMIPGILIAIILLCLSILFVGLVILTNWLPMQYVGIILLVLMLFTMIDYLLVLNMRKVIRFIIGLLFALVLGAGLVVGSYYLYNTYSALKEITDTKKDVARIDVMVDINDPAESLEDVRDYSYGILSQLDRKTTDAAIDQLQEKFGQDLDIIEYEGLTDLADAITKKRCQAILMNHAYLDVMEEMSGTEEFSSQLKVVHSIDIESIVEPEEKTYTSKPLQDGSNIKAVDGEITDVYTILISGIDTRGAMTARSLSDVNIIATINANTHQVLMISTPRDYFVPLSISNGVPDKLTHAGIYGIEVVEATQEMLYDLDIDYYFRINFGGFIKIIDTLGGIDVNSDYAFTAAHGQFNYQAGENHLNGEQALSFCRERYSFSDGDRQRGRNQMKVIQAVANKVLSPDLLGNYLSLLESTKDCFDTNIPYNVIADMVKKQLSTNSNWTFYTYSTTGSDDNQKPYSMSQHAYVMQPDYTTVEKAKDLMQRVRSNEVMTQDKIDEVYE